MKTSPTDGFSTNAEVRTARKAWAARRAAYMADPSKENAAAVRAALRVVESAEIRLQSFAARVS